MNQEHAKQAGALLSSRKAIESEFPAVSLAPDNQPKPGILDRPAHQAYLERVHQAIESRGHLATDWDRTFIKDIYQKACDRDALLEFSESAWNPTVRQWNQVKMIGEKLGV